MQDFRQFLSEFQRLAGLKEAPESTRGRGRSVLPASRPGNETAPAFDNRIEMQPIGDKQTVPPNLDPRQMEPAADPIVPRRANVITPTPDAENRAFDPGGGVGGARFLPGRAAQTRIENPPDPRLQDQFAREIGAFIPGVGAALSGYDAYKAAQEGDYAGAVGNAGAAVAQTFLPGGLVSAGRAALAPFRQAARTGTDDATRAAAAALPAASTRAGTGVSVNAIDDLAPGTGRSVATGSPSNAAAAALPAASTRAGTGVSVNAIDDLAPGTGRSVATVNPSNAPVTGATRGQIAAGTAGLGTAIVAPSFSTQADGDKGEAEARAAETARQRNLRLTGSTQADGDTGEAEARARNQADQDLERSRQTQADISTGGYSGGRENRAEVSSEIQQASGTGITPGTAGQGFRYPPGTTFSPQVMQGRLPPQTSSAASTPAAPLPTPPQMYQIGKGDTLSQIAAKSGTSVAAIMAANPQITNPDRISVGQKINLTGLPAASTYAGGVGTVADTQAKIKAGVYTPDVISAQAAQRAAASPFGMPNTPGSGPAQMTGRMVPSTVGTTTQPGSTSAITQGVNQAIASRPTPQPITQGSSILPTPLAPGQFTSAITGGTTGSRSNQPADTDAKLDAMLANQEQRIRDRVPRGPETSSQTSKLINNPNDFGVATTTGTTNTASPPAPTNTNVNQAGFNAAQARADRRAEELKAQRDASPAWQNAPTVTTTNPDGSTTSTKEASWTVPPNPNAAGLNNTSPSQGKQANFEESLIELKNLAGLRK